MLGETDKKEKQAQELIKAWYKSFLCRSFSTSLENSQYSLENCAPIRPTVTALLQFPYCRTFCGLWSAYWGRLINSLILKKKIGDTGQRPQQNAHFRLRKVNHFTSASPFDILCEWSWEYTTKSRHLSKIEKEILTKSPWSCSCRCSPLLHFFNIIILRWPFRQPCWQTTSVRILRAIYFFVCLWSAGTARAMFELCT